MKITQGPTNRLEHCCDCGACSEHIDAIKHAQHCDGIRKEQQWTVCGIYHFAIPTNQEVVEVKVEVEDFHGCRECLQAGTMFLQFKAEPPFDIQIYTCGHCKALEVSTPSYSHWYHPAQVVTA